MSLVYWRGNSGISSARAVRYSAKPSPVTFKVRNLLQLNPLQNPNPECHGKLTAEKLLQQLYLSYH